MSITGYGYDSPQHDRVAFGDDAAVAGGVALAAGGPDDPVFVLDAVADPLSGLVAAAAAPGAAAGGTRRLRRRVHGGVVNGALAAAAVDPGPAGSQ